MKKCLILTSKLNITEMIFKSSGKVVLGSENQNIAGILWQFDVIANIKFEENFRASPCLLCTSFENLCLETKGKVPYIKKYDFFAIFSYPTILEKLDSTAQIVRFFNQNKPTQLQSIPPPTIPHTTTTVINQAACIFFSIILTLEKFKKKMQKANKRQRNARISLKRRQNLIDLIEKEQFTLCRAARKLNIKFSTARLILKKYEETGTFFNKNMRRVRKGKEEHVKVEEDDSQCMEESMEDQELNETQEKGKSSAEEAVTVKSQESAFPFVNNYFFFWNSLPYYYVAQPDQIVQSSL